ncbi:MULTISPECIES: hypothetical protein [Kamptonema]|uniref:hypothetical protein n=1 Tax=Kamptonema TaxID=1501433 RepID=UPI0001DAD0B2|nr:MULTISPECIES: hypothetical protein [Kamptonema]CBN57657.1 hypothetical protein OSCI_3490037 [Kamptonema sp. PCC 6506]
MLICPLQPISKSFPAKGGSLVGNFTAVKFDYAIISRFVGGRRLGAGAIAQERIFSLAKGKISGDRLVPNPG